MGNTTKRIWDNVSSTVNRNTIHNDRINIGKPTYDEIINGNDDVNSINRYSWSLDALYYEMQLEKKADGNAAHEITEPLTREKRALEARVTEFISRYNIQEALDIQAFKKNYTKNIEVENELIRFREELGRSADLKEESQLILPDTPAIITDVRLVNQTILERINRDPNKIYQLSSWDFEIMCAELYEERGYKVILTKKTRDEGKDLIILDNGDLGTFMIYGECKRFAPDRTVGVNVVKQLAANIWADRATAGIVMTSSNFSRDAKEFAGRFEHQLSLIDFTAFQKMMAIKK